jgi:mannose-1-phosphate guanylyltransferase/mannose-6-phosphate isomerase
MIVMPVILAGGLGSRLWPLSRESMPKQFIRLFEHEKSLFQETLSRVSDPSFFQAPIILCQEEHRFIAAEQLRKNNISPKTIILEPMGRSTAPCVALAAFYAVQRDPNAILLVLSADHIIASTPHFIESVKQGLSAVDLDYLVTFGVAPTAPETGYGYLKMGKNLNEQVFEVAQFVEKPDSELAKKYLESGAYLWNAGIFLFKASDYLTELSRHAPTIHESCQQAMVLAKSDMDFIRPDKHFFESCPSDSIDYAVMEKSTRVAMVKLTTEWSDVGSWDALANCYIKDDNGNTLQGEGIVTQTTNCHIHATHRLVSLVGVENLVVVETKDAVLVSSKEKSQEVKNIVSQLAKANRPEVQQASCVARPWGSYEAIDRGERYQVKRITVAIGAKLSLQLHHHRSEHWVVVKGTARVTRDNDQFLLSENQSTYIPTGSVHRLENVGKIPLEIIEIQSGAYLGEDDIVRLEDHYGRQDEGVLQTV